MMLPNQNGYSSWCGVKGDVRGYEEQMTCFQAKNLSKSSLSEGETESQIILRKYGVVGKL